MTNKDFNLGDFDSENISDSEENKAEDNKNQDQTDSIDDLDLKNEEDSDLKTENDLVKEKEEDITISKSKMILVKKLLDNIKESNEQLIKLLSGMVSSEDEDLIRIGQMSDEKFEAKETLSDEGKIIEGVFDGENMIGPDGKQYSVPANYASKSKLVEGDIMKLTITSNGTFVYKQIGPIERTRVVGQLEKTADGHFIVVSDGQKWYVLAASATFFKGEVGDEVVILIPKAGESKWAAIENIVKKS